MASVKFTIRGRKDVDELEKFTAAGAFVGARLKVEVPELGHLGEARRVAKELEKWKSAYEEEYAIEIDQEEKLKAAAEVSRALRSAAKMIRKADGKVRGSDNYKHLCDLSAIVRVAALRLPRQVEQGILVVNNDLERTAGTGKKAGLVRRKLLIRIGEKITRLQGSPITLRPPPPAPAA